MKYEQTNQSQVTIMEWLSLLIFLASMTAICHASVHGGLPLPINLLRPKSGCGEHLKASMSCDSWRLAVETNNIQNWYNIPVECQEYVGNYMLGDLYRADSKLVVDVAASYVQSLNLAGDAKDVWVFDIDETTLSNLPWYVSTGFGAKPYNATSFNEWVMLGQAPALPESVEFYKKLLSLGVKIVFITGRTEDQRNATATNLKNEGYHTWEELILRGSSEIGQSAVVYKSARRKKLEEQGYRIIGNMGDQWSDILGTNVGDRTFKLPDPMYYIA